jgi:filamentous hemagglutinin family protein
MAGKLLKGIREADTEMIKSWKYLGLAVILAVGEIFATIGNKAIAQSITLDGTLGPAQTLTGPTYTIPQSVGQTVGSNLFHSFGIFNLNAGERANFGSAGDIRNILSRVTGGSASMIDGLIFTNSPNVNLFLINPSGIVFGPNARLNVGGSTRGSFVATTVDALVWSNGSQFSATNPGNASSLLTIVGDPSGFLSTLRTPPPIEVSGSSLINGSSNSNPYNGQSLLLVGGDVKIDNATLQAPGGKIELGGLAGAGIIGLNINDNILSLNFTPNLARADVSLSNGARLNTLADNEGSIGINARNIDILGGSRLLAGIDSGLGNVNSQAGDVKLNATDAIRIEDSSRIQSDVNRNATGNAGNINISAGSLSVTNGSQLSASTFGQGNAGSVIIDARDRINFDGTNSDDTFASAAFSRVERNAVGIGGDIRVSTGSLSVTNGAQLTASTLGQGNAGGVFIDAKSSVSLDGDNTTAFSSVGEGATGNAGNIRINTGSLSVTNGAQLLASTLGQGNAGSVFINAQDVLFNGTSSDGNSPSAAFSRVNQGAIGTGGNISITTNSLFVRNGARLTASSNGQGDAGSVIIDARDQINFDGSDAFSSVGENAVGKGGDIRINTGSLSVTNGAQLVASTFGQGNAGSVFIDAQDILFDGTSSDGNFPSAAFSRVNQGAIGAGGNISITTNSLFVRNGARLTANTLGEGNAGSVIIDARDRTVFDAGDAFSSVGENAVGKGGDIRINTGLLSVTNGAQLLANTLGSGDAGSVFIDARAQINFDGGDAFSSVEESGIGKGGDIRINTGSLSVTNGAQLLANTRGRGDAGSVFINAQDILFDGTSSDGNFPSAAFSRVNQGAIGTGGNISITTGSLSVSNGAQLLASTLGQGNAGSVIINASDRTVFDAGDAFSNIEEGAIGTGGDIRINTGSLSVTNGAQLLANTRGRGDAGSVFINAQDVLFNGTSSDGNFPSAAFSRVNQGAIGAGGNISITTNSLSVRNGAQLSASTFGQGNAGSVIIDAQNVLFNQGFAFSSVEENAIGNAGDIRINTGSLSVTNGGQLIANTDGQGDAGNIQIQADNAINVSGTSSTSGRSSALFTDTSSTGKGGDITVNTNLFRLSDAAVLDARTNNQGNGGNITVNASLFEALNGGQLLSTTSGSGNAGKITVNATKRVTVNGSDATFNERVAQFGTRVANVDANSGFFVRSESSGSAGDIEVNSPKVILDNKGRFIAQSASGNGGNISLQVPDILLLRRGSQISASAGTAPAGGNGGNININAGFIVAVPQEDSDITANAFSGSGGKVEINAQGLFGIQSRPRLTPESDITASSESGVSGVIAINTLNIEPINAFVDLPTNIVNASGLINPSCSAFDGKEGSTFLVTGRGGLPSSPDDFLSSDVVWSDTRLTALPVSPSPRVTPSVRKTAEGVAIVPATGWVFDEKKGEVTLIASNGNSSGVGSNQVKCIVP